MQIGRNNYVHPSRRDLEMALITGVDPRPMFYTFWYDDNDPGTLLHHCSCSKVSGCMVFACPDCGCYGNWGPSWEDIEDWDNVSKLDMTFCSCTVLGCRVSTCDIPNCKKKETSGVSTL